MSEPPEGYAWTPVCEDMELAEGQFREFDVGDQPCFIFRRNGDLLGYRNRCPHLGITLNWAPERFMDLDQCFIHCSTHGALFTPEDGTCIAGPCQGDQLAPLRLRVQGATIEARL